MSNQSQGNIWPYAIVISILLIVAAAAATVMIAVDNPVEMSNTNMQNYHDYDRNANAFIEEKIAFDKKYKITYASEKLDLNDAVVAFKVTDSAGTSVNGARLNIVLTRPDNQDSDIILDNPNVDNGVYTFEAGKLPLEGRWNIMAHVVAGENERYYHLKADTRYPKVFEY